MASDHSETQANISSTASPEIVKTLLSNIHSQVISAVNDLVNQTHTQCDVSTPIVEEVPDNVEVPLAPVTPSDVNTQSHEGEDQTTKDSSLEQSKTSVEILDEPKVDVTPTTQSFSEHNQSLASSASFKRSRVEDIEDLESHPTKKLKSDSDTPLIHTGGSCDPWSDHIPADVATTTTTPRNDSQVHA